MSWIKKVAKQICLFATGYTIFHLCFIVNGYLNSFKPMYTLLILNLIHLPNLMQDAQADLTQWITSPNYIFVDVVWSTSRIFFNQSIKRAKRSWFQSKGHQIGINLRSNLGLSSNLVYMEIWFKSVKFAAKFFGILSW